MRHRRGKPPAPDPRRDDWTKFSGRVADEFGVPVDIVIGDSLRMSNGIQGDYQAISETLQVRPGPMVEGQIGWRIIGEIPKFEVPRGGLRFVHFHTEALSEIDRLILENRREVERGWTALQDSLCLCRWEHEGCCEHDPTRLRGDCPVHGWSDGPDR